MLRASRIMMVMYIKLFLALNYFTFPFGKCMKINDLTVTYLKYMSKIKQNELTLLDAAR